MSAARKTTAKKSTGGSAGTSRTATKKPSATKTTKTTKATATKSVARKTAAKKSSVRKASGRKQTTRTPAGKKASAKKSAQKTSAKKSAQKTSVKKSAQKTSVKKTAARKAPARTRASATPARKSPARRRSKPPAKLDKQTLAGTRRQLREELADLQRQWQEIEEGSRNGTQSEVTGEVGIDEDFADAGTATFDRERDQSIQNNVRDLIDQVSRALRRIDAGTYGDCERCGRPIDRARLKALPRTLLCMDCKRREERAR